MISFITRTAVDTVWRWGAAFFLYAAPDNAPPSLGTPDTTCATLTPTGFLPFLSVRCVFQPRRSRSFVIPDVTRTACLSQHVPSSECLWGLLWSTFLKIFANVLDGICIYIQIQRTYVNIRTTYLIGLKFTQSMSYHNICFPCLKHWGKVIFLDWRG